MFASGDIITGRVEGHIWLWVSIVSVLSFFVVLREWLEYVGLLRIIREVGSDYMSGDEEL